MAAESYSKDVLIKSTGLSVMDRDILKIVLKNDRTYTMREAKKLIRNFKGGIK